MSHSWASAGGIEIGPEIVSQKLGEVGVETRPCPLDHGTGSRSQILMEATSTVPAKM
jgi:hypothetical protein